MNIFIFVLIVYGLVLVSLTAAIATLTRRRSDKCKIDTAIQPIKLHVASQNFGTVKGKERLVLDDNNSLLYPYSKYDVFAFQELLIPDSRFDSTNKGKGKIDSFGPNSNKRMGVLVASVVTTLKNKDVPCQKCMGLAFNPNLNFAIDKQENVIDSESGKGSLVVTGTLYNKYRVAFASVHLIWDAQKGGFKNAKNDELVEKLLNYIKEAKVDYYVLMGDFNTAFSVMKKNITTTWRKILPDLKSELDNLEKTLVTSYADDGYANPDHILSNLQIEWFRTNLYKETDHMCIFSALQVPVPKNMAKNQVVLLSANSRIVFKDQNI